MIKQKEITTQRFHVLQVMSEIPSIVMTGNEIKQAYEEKMGHIGNVHGVLSYLRDKGYLTKSKEGWMLTPLGKSQIAGEHCKKTVKDLTANDSTKTMTYIEQKTIEQDTRLRDIFKKLDIQRTAVKNHIQQLNEAIEKTREALEFDLQRLRKLEAAYNNEQFTDFTQSDNGSC